MSHQFNWAVKQREFCSAEPFYLESSRVGLFTSQAMQVMICFRWLPARKVLFTLPSKTTPKKGSWVMQDFLASSVSPTPSNWLLKWSFGSEKCLQNKWYGKSPTFAATATLEGIKQSEKADSLIQWFEKRIKIISQSIVIWSEK